MWLMSSSVASGSYLQSAIALCSLLLRPACCSVLQLGSEEVEQSLTDVSTAALRRVPFAQQEVSRLKGDVAGLQVCVLGRGVLGFVGSKEGTVQAEGRRGSLAGVKVGWSPRGE